MHADRTSGGPAGVLLDVAPSGPDGMPVTPAYTAPERVRDEVAGPAADVYALGLTLYEAVTGVATFRGQGDAVLHQQLVRTPPEPRQLTPDLPAALNNLIMQMIDKDPTARPRVGEVQTALQALTQTRTVEASPLAEQVNVLLGGGRPQLTRLTLTPDGGRLRASFKPQDPGVRLDGAVSVAWTPPGRPAVAYRGAPHGPGGVVLQRSSSWRDAPPAQLEVRNPLQVRLAPGGGDAFVLDGDVKAVVRFKASGRPVGRIGPVPPGVGRLLKPVAFCRPQDGRTFVLDAGRNLVYAYAADGTFERAFGLQGAGDTQPREVAGMAVDDAGRLLLVDARTARLRTLTPGGTLEGSLPLPTELELTGAQVFLKPTRGLVLLGVRGAHEVWALRRDGAAPVRVPLPGMLQDLP
jgi:serine/threonine-protein kinase